MTLEVPDSYVLLGACFGVLFGFVLALALGKHLTGSNLLPLAFSFGVGALIFAERRKKAKSLEVLNRPQSLNP